jgi:hypothetical protein
VHTTADTVAGFKDGDARPRPPELPSAGKAGKSRANHHHTSLGFFGSAERRRGKHETGTRGECEFHEAAAGHATRRGPGSSGDAGNLAEFHRVEKTVATGDA